MQKVIVSVKPRMPKAEGEAAAPPAKEGKGPPEPPPAVGDNPFDVEPKEVVIPPHEHRYVSCFFKPGNMMIEWRRGRPRWHRSVLPQEHFGWFGGGGAGGVAGASSPRNPPRERCTNRPSIS